MRQEHPRIEEAGAQAAAVFMGPPSGVDGFCRERGVPFDCYSDPDRSAYGAFGLTTAGTRQLVSTNIVRSGLKVLRRGVAMGLPHPGQDVRQMPGTFVIARGGTVRFAHYNADTADDPPMSVVLGALGA